MNIKQAVVLSLSVFSSAFAMPLANAETHTVNQSVDGGVSGSNRSSINMQKAFDDFQKDADIIRLQHLKYWVTLIEEYQQKIGKYPFQGLSQYPPAPAITKGMTEFVQTLEKGLGREIDEYYDPQHIAYMKPNFYIYMIKSDVYYFAVHTNEKYAFAKTIHAPHYNKVEVSNVYNPSANLVVTSKILFPSKPYQMAINKPVQKPKFFQQRSKKTLHVTKTNLKDKSKNNLKSN